MSVISISLLILLGILLIIVELLIFPGITLAGIAGVILIIGGIVLGYHYHELRIGNFVLLGSGVALITLVFIALKTKTWRRFGLSATVEGKVRQINSDQVKTGDIGVTVSRLAPIGKARIRETLLEVRSEGNYIDEGVNVSITRISGNKVYVEPKD